MTNEDLVLLDRQDRIAYVTLNRPEKLNALTPDTYARLAEVWREVAEDDSVRVVVLRGAGRAFCVGNDLGGRDKRSHIGIVNDRKRVRDMLNADLAAWDLPKPVIAQIHGHCFAGGTLMASLTDIIVIAEDTRVGWPKVPVGGGVIGPVWSWFVPPHKAKEFSFRVGFTMTGREAVEMGWGNYAVRANELEERVTAIATEIARVPLEVLQLKKASHNNMMDARGFRTAIMQTADVDAIVHATEAVHRVNAKLGEVGIRGAIDWFEKGGA